MGKGEKKYDNRLMVAITKIQGVVEILEDIEDILTNQIGISTDIEEDL